jgi:hypothetical protein
MPTAEERMRILKMISEKRITADEGARLLEALRTSEAGPERGEARGARWLRVKVTDRHNDRIKLNVTIPVGLVDVGLKMGARFTPDIDGMDVQAIQTAIRNGVQGRILSLDDEDDQERVEIFVE